jgi:hypothetical protein
MDTTSDTASLVEPSAGGTGLSQSPADSLERDVPGYVDYADRFGRVLGSPGGAGPPEGTEFVRRWAIHPAVVHEQTVILFQVFVTSSPGRTRAGLDRWRRLQDEAWLVAAKARRTP